MGNGYIEITINIRFETYDGHRAIIEIPDGLWFLPTHLHL